MKNKIINSAVFFLCATTSTFAATTTIPVLNNDFETPVITHADKWDIFPSGTSGLGWNVEWFGGANTYNPTTRPVVANLELQKTGHLGYTAYSGNQYAELDSDWFGPNFPSQSNPASINIWQDLPTVLGLHYIISFAFAARPDAPDSTQNVLRIKWSSSTLDTVSSTNISHTNIEWILKSYDVIATASTTRLEFTDLGVPNALGTYLDAVKVSEISSTSIATTTPTSTIATSTIATSTLATSTIATTSVSTTSIPATIIVSAGGGGGGGGGSIVIPTFGGVGNVTPVIVPVQLGGGSTVSNIPSVPTVLGASTTGDLNGENSPSTLPNMPNTGLGDNRNSFYFLFFLFVSLIEIIYFTNKNYSKNRETIN